MLWCCLCHEMIPYLNFATFIAQNNTRKEQIATCNKFPDRFNISTKAASNTHCWVVTLRKSILSFCLSFFFFLKAESGSWIWQPVVFYYQTNKKMKTGSIAHYQSMKCNWLCLASHQCTAEQKVITGHRHLCKWKYAWTTKADIT